LAQFARYALEGFFLVHAGFGLELRYADGNFHRSAA